MNIAVDSEKVEKMLRHYIKERKNEQREVPGTYNQGWLSGACAEAEKWLKMLEVNFSNGINITADPEKVEEMFQHYIKERKNEQREVPGTYNQGWLSGAYIEAEKWLKMFEIDFSNERIQPMLEGAKEIKAFN